MSLDHSRPARIGRERSGFLEVFPVFLRLGLFAFGGPLAHLGYFRTELVERRRWLDERAFADIVALCQFLPGPASSQTGLSIGLLRAGLPGGLAAWLGFTMPSALAMITFGYGVSRLGDLTNAAWLHGLKIVAVAVVANAVWGMARSLCPDRERATIAVSVAAVAMALPPSLGQVAAIAGGGLIGWWFLGDGAASTPNTALAIRLPRSLSIVCLLLFFVLMVGLPLLGAARLGV
jgi:chromate transporter